MPPPLRLRSTSLLALLAGALLLSSAAPVNAAPVPASDPQRWTNPISLNRAHPHVCLHKDGWYYFTASVPEYDRVEPRRARTLGGLTTAEPKILENSSANPLEGEWILKPRIVLPIDTGALDATVFEHRGARYLAWSQRPPEPMAATSTSLAWTPLGRSPAIR